MGCVLSVEDDVLATVAVKVQPIAEISVLIFEEPLTNEIAVTEKIDTYEKGKEVFKGIESETGLVIVIR